MAINDAWTGAINFSGTSGSGSGDLFGATIETGEPALDPGRRRRGGNPLVHVHPDQSRHSHPYCRKFFSGRG
jgi:hypothetical protein